jgi:hypothetical protein
VCFLDTVRKGGLLLLTVQWRIPAFVIDCSRTGRDGMCVFLMSSDIWLLALRVLASANIFVMAGSREY